MMSLALMFSPTIFAFLISELSACFGSTKFHSDVLFMDRKWNSNYHSRLQSILKHFSLYRSFQQNQIWRSALMFLIRR
jgi:hypothetical protein